jgi:hypothetical protein
MNEAITLRCDKCQREQAYPREVDPSIPANVATIVFSRCDRCDNGDFGTEWWLDASGHLVDNASAFWYRECAARL